jgi:pimeloyl-ACP methyl ester carboxylesterase
VFVGPTARHANTTGLARRLELQTLKPMARHFTVHAVNRNDPSDMLVTVAAEDSFDASPRLHRITAPTLLVAGARDRFYTPELFRETARRIPGARLRLYPGKGHAGVMTHRPATREIVAFLTADRAEA